MTFNEIVDSVLLRVSGGKLSGDVDVRKPDIEVLVGPTIELVQHNREAQDIYRNLRIARHQGAYPGYQGISYSSYTLTSEYDSTRELSYLNLPGTPTRELHSKNVLHPIKGKSTSYIEVTSQADLAGIPEGTTVNYWWTERYNDNDVLFIWGPNQNACDYILRMSFKVDTMDGNVDTGLSEGIEMEVIDLLVAFFTGQRSMFRDLQQDNTDLNAKA